MLIGSNEACRVLATCGVGRRHAQRVLASGLAGPPRRIRSRVLYDAELVGELARRRDVTWVEVTQLCPDGLFISRRDVSVAQPREAMIEELSRGWEAVSPWNLVPMSWQVRSLGSMPMVATVAGFVVLGADIVDVRGFSGLTLVDPGPWFVPLEHTRVRTGRGRPWVLDLGPRQFGAGGGGGVVGV